ncbi:NUDIX hydrolase [Erysipelothrix inopinata]|uniref:NUDIX hydrolase n=1 Tax=Erysipelothrix inopinata TaxID=225084 RepID=A0A7G9RX96_9FIRM|nr:NUDIX hydrolase [Erysipelothrix inopinata]QNN60221.1 NUDIX hydrolase [Erysipelothrix inopinata]
MLLNELYDTIYPNTGFSTIRKTARAFVKNETDEIALIHIKAEDIFGPRDHYESPGGGIEFGESREDAIKREVSEELGYNCEIESYMGSIINRYNLLEVITVHHYFICNLKEKTSVNLTDAEEIFFEGVEWKSVEEWIEILSKPLEGVNQLVHDRELFMLNQYKMLRDSKE